MRGTLVTLLLGGNPQQFTRAQLLGTLRDALPKPEDRRDLANLESFFTNNAWSPDEPQSALTSDARRIHARLGVYDETKLVTRDTDAATIQAMPRAQIFTTLYPSS